MCKIGKAELVALIQMAISVLWKSTCPVQRRKGWIQMVGRLSECPTKALRKLDGNKWRQEEMLRETKRLQHTKKQRRLYVPKSDPCVIDKVSPITRECIIMPNCKTYHTVSRIRTTAHLNRLTSMPMICLLLRVIDICSFSSFRRITDPESI